MLLCVSGIGNNITIAEDVDSFGDYCLFCLERLFEKRFAALREIENAEYGYENASICEDCYQEHHSEQRRIALMILSDFLDDYDIDILEDDTDYSDDLSTAKYSDCCFYLDIYSFSILSDTVSAAAEITGSIEVAKRLNTRGNYEK
jgi:hypothetical protein